MLGWNCVWIFVDFEVSASSWKPFLKALGSRYLTSESSYFSVPIVSSTHALTLPSPWVAMFNLNRKNTSFLEAKTSNTTKIHKQFSSKFIYTFLQNHLYLKYGHIFRILSKFITKCVVGKFRKHLINTLRKFISFCFFSEQ